MSTVQLQQPVLDGGIYSVNFFNGRLLSGEDLTKEQGGDREARNRLGNAIGTGIVTGLTVTKTPPPLPGEEDPGPSVTVARGLGINSLGQTLRLATDTIVQVASPLTTGTTTAAGAFSPSQPAPTGQYTLGEGIYLLTLSYKQADDGLSPVNAFSDSSNSTTASCNSRFSVEAVRFRLIQITIPGGMPPDAALLRNRMAYRCFGFSDASPSPTTDSFRPLDRNARYLETLQQNTAQDGSIDLTQDVPLAILDWSSDGSLKFLDTWSVRRRLVRPIFSGPWQDSLGDQRLAEAEAMFLQFQSQLDDTLQGFTTGTQTTSTQQAGQAPPTTPGTLSADQFCTFIPAAGYLPVGDGALDWKTFLGTLAPQDITSVDRRFFRQILHNSFYESPIKVGNYGDNSPSNEPPVDVYQDPDQPDFVLFARSNSGRVQVSVSAQGYQPASMYVSFTFGQKTQLTIPLTQAALAPGQPTSQAVQPPVSVDMDSIARPALHRVRFSIVQQPAKAAVVPAQMIKVDSMPKNALDWLGQWRTWFDVLNPNQGIGASTPAIYINDYYTAPMSGATGSGVEKEDTQPLAGAEQQPPDQAAADNPPAGDAQQQADGQGAAGIPPADTPLEPGNIPERPWAYAVFGNFAVPLLVVLHYYTTPLPVPLAKAGIAGLTDDIVEGLAGVGVSSVDQLAGAWTHLVAKATGQNDEFADYLIEDAILAVQDINEHRLYYEGIDDEVAQTLAEMALIDDVSLANADQNELGDNLHSMGLASRLIMQARRAVPLAAWSLDSLKLPAEQLPSLKQIGVNSMGEFVKMAEDSTGHKKLESALQQDPKTIDQLHDQAVQLITASSLAEARIKDPIMLPNVNAQVATKLAESGINTVDDIHRADKNKLIQVTGLSEDAVEDLRKEAKEAGKEGREVVKLAAVTKDVAKVLDFLQVKTVAQLLDKNEDQVANQLQETHGERAKHFLKALLDGIRGAGR